MVALALILAAVLLYTEARITARNTGTWFNGFGSIIPVVRGQAQKPMQYRVLVPWLYMIMPFPPGIKLYLIIKYIGMAFALLGFGTFSYTLGIPWQLSMPMLAAVLPMMFLFDYADCYYEFGFLCIAWSMGQQHLAALCVVAFLASLNRETGVFVPIGHYALFGGEWQSAVILGASLIGLAVPCLIYGRKPRYCSLSQVKENVKALGEKKLVVEYLWCSLLFLAYAYVGIMAVYPFEGFRNLYGVMAAFGLLMLIPSRWNEVRVFMPMLAVLIPMCWYL